MLKKVFPKATIDFDAVEPGFLAKILVPDGTKDIKVNTPIAIVVEEKDDISAFEDYDVEAEYGKDESQESKSEETSEVKEETPKKEAEPKKQPSRSNEEAGEDKGGRVKASPVAKAVGKEKGINLENVSGSGPNGRVILNDVLKYRGMESESSVQRESQNEAQETKQGKSEQSFPSSSSAPSSANYEDLDVSGIRKVTAQRLTESKVRLEEMFFFCFFCKKKRKEMLFIENVHDEERNEILIMEKK